MSNVQNEVVINTTGLDNAVKKLITNSEKRLEKLALYVVGVLNSTGVIHMTGKNSADVVTGAVTALLVALHISTPIKKN
jgi:hypothetical protein